MYVIQPNFPIEEFLGLIHNTRFDPRVLDLSLNAVKDLGKRWLIEEGYIKLHAAGRYAHAAIDALEDAARRGDAAAAWLAFADQEKGVNLLSTACSGYPGW